MVKIQHLLANNLTEMNTILSNVSSKKGLFCDLQPRNHSAGAYSAMDISLKLHSIGLEIELVSAVIDHRYRAALIFPRCLATDGPEEGADGEEDWLENHVEKTTKTPKNFGDFLFDELRDPNKLFTSMLF